MTPLPWKDKGGNGQAALVTATLAPGPELSLPPDLSAAKTPCFLSFCYKHLSADFCYKNLIQNSVSSKGSV